MSEKLTVAELMARNAKDGARRADRPRRRRNLEDGGVSVSELTGSIPVVSDEDIDGAPESSGAAETVEAAETSSPSAPVADEHPRRGGHELDDEPEVEPGPDRDAVHDESPDAVVEGEVVAVEAEAVEPETEDSEAGAGAAPVSDETAVIPKVVSEEAAPAVAPAATAAPTDQLVAETDTEDAPQDEPASEPVSGDIEEAPDEVQEEVDPDAIIEYEDDAISWPALLGQTAVAVVIGVIIFFGFTLLWDKLGTFLVLVMSAVVTLGCVGVVHALLRHRHALVLILAFIVGLVITLGPRLIMSI